MSYTNEKIEDRSTVRQWIMYFNNNTYIISEKTMFNTVVNVQNKKCLNQLNKANEVYESKHSSALKKIKNKNGMVFLII